MPSSIKIIIVEDDPLPASIMRRCLEADGYQVAVAICGADLRLQYRSEGADLVLLDLNLGAEDGMDLARELAATTAVGLIIVSGRADLRDRVEGLDAGADDYLIKPVALAELRARVRAVLRRRGQAVKSDGRLRAGSATLDSRTRRLCREGGEDVVLTETETLILAELIRHTGCSISRANLRRGADWSPDDRSVDVHIGRIRRKLREANYQELIILPIRGHGYRLTVEPQPSIS
ncbi:DNA-binding response regulator [Thiocystis minor]|uniref:response regulator n=1 Tax=Thiocystis minor TaxID=61597 RepID=UPI001914CDFB|nr:DNA-binding response regulator [Thiocystis minor]